MANVLTTISTLGAFPFHGMALVVFPISGIDLASNIWLLTLTFGMQVLSAGSLKQSIFSANSERFEPSENLNSKKKYESERVNRHRADIARLEKKS